MSHNALYTKQIMRQGATIINITVVRSYILKKIFKKYYISIVFVSDNMYEILQVEAPCMVAEPQMNESIKVL